MGTIKKIKSKTIEIKLYTKHLKTPNKDLVKAAKVIGKGIKTHFKKDGWDLAYTHYVSDVFREAYNHNLENYLLKELGKQGLKLKSGKRGLLISK